MSNPDRDLFLKSAGAQKVVTHASLLRTLTPVLADIKQTLKAQQDEIAALKARPLQKWAGTHVEGVPYSEASLVTRGGSLWAATCATKTTPGSPGSDWRLIVKKGAYSGRDITGE